MKLRPIDPSEIDLVARWLSQKDNCRWLDFGNGVQTLSPVAIKVMMQRDIHLMRIFTSDSESTPIGLVALSNIDRKFKTATMWCVLGNKNHAGQGYSTRAVSEILTLGFKDLGLQAINAWAVDQNTSSVRMIRRNHFCFIGVQRRCHYMDGRPHDRLLFDILASEHTGDDK